MEEQMMKKDLGRGSAVADGSRAAGPSLHGRRQTIGGMVALLCPGMSLGWGPAPDAQKPLPPGVTPPARSTALVELTVPASIKLALEGTKLTQNRTKGEVITEGEATL